MSWFSDHAVLFALLCAGAAVAYGLYLTRWLLSQPAGTERMQEIARAVQEGAAAYLRRQYTTVAVVAIAPFLILGFYMSAFVARVVRGSVAATRVHEYIDSARALASDLGMRYQTAPSTSVVVLSDTTNPVSPWRPQPST